MTQFVISATVDENKNLTLADLPNQNQGENNCTAIHVALPEQMTEGTDFFLEFLCPQNKRYISPKLQKENGVYVCQVPSCTLQETGFVALQLVARSSDDHCVVWKSNYSNKTAFFVHASVNATTLQTVPDYFAKMEQKLAEVERAFADVEELRQSLESFADHSNSEDSGLAGRISQLESDLQEHLSDGYDELEERVSQLESDLQTHVTAAPSGGVASIGGLDGQVDVGRGLTAEDGAITGDFYLQTATVNHALGESVTVLNAPGRANLTLIGTGTINDGVLTFTATNRNGTTRQKTVSLANLTNTVYIDAVWSFNGVALFVADCNSNDERIVGYHSEYLRCNQPNVTVTLTSSSNISVKEYSHNICHN